MALPPLPVAEPRTMVNRRGLVAGGGFALPHLAVEGWVVRHRLGSMTDHDAAMAAFKAVPPPPQKCMI